jgi:hypothetical protein
MLKKTTRSFCLLLKEKSYIYFNNISINLNENVAKCENTFGEKVQNKNN